MKGASCSGEHVTVGEIVNIEHLAGDGGLSNQAANIPFPVLLEDAFPGDAECITKGIESRLGGDGLPSAVKHFQGVFRHGGDQVPMQENLASACLRVEGHASVTTGPVGVALDGSDHLGFDFAHGVVWLT